MCGCVSAAGVLFCVPGTIRADDQAGPAQQVDVEPVDFEQSTTGSKKLPSPGTAVISDLFQAVSIVNGHAP